LEGTYEEYFSEEKCQVFHITENLIIMNQEYEKINKIKTYMINSLTINTLWIQSETCMKLSLNALWLKSLRGKKQKMKTLLLNQIYFLKQQLKTIVFLTSTPFSVVEFYLTVLQLFYIHLS